LSAIYDGSVARPGEFSGDEVEQ